MKKIFLFLLAALLPVLVFAQWTWNQKANFPGPGRGWGMGFSIGNKGYFGTGGINGTTYFKDFWEWDKATNTWTQKADFDGNVRAGAVGFSIGTKGYVGTGNSYPPATYHKDLWEYDPATNSWMGKISFGGTARMDAVAFSIGIYGYIGTGGPASTGTTDFWEYNGPGDFWTQKANVPGSNRTHACGFSIGTKGYIGTGINTTSGYRVNDFWEWNRTTNAWTQKANFANNTTYSMREYAVGFSIGGKGYMGCGNGGGGYNSEFWEYDTTANTWTQIPNLPGAPRGYNDAFSIGATGYVVGGIQAGNVPCYEFWELTVCNLSITGTATTICKGQSATLNGAYTPSSANVTYSWTPAAGLSSTTVANPVASPVATTTYMLTAKDTVTLCQAVKSFTVTIPLLKTQISGPLQICSGQPSYLCANGGWTSYSWSTGQTTSCITVAPTTSTAYSLDTWDPYGCPVHDTVTVVVNPCSGGMLCANNEGFENGNFWGWTGETGTNDFANSGTINWTGGLNSLGNDLPPSSASQHTLLTINQLDPYTIDSITGQPDVFMTTLSPVNGLYTVRLGNSQTMFGAERLRISFFPTAVDSQFVFQYAMVCQYTGHVLTHEPGFAVNVYGPAGTLYPPLCDTIYGPDPVVPLLHVHPSAPDPTVLYKRWAARAIDFSSLMGQNVTIEFVNFDCGEGGHWGYVYLDVACSGVLTSMLEFDPNKFTLYPNPSGGLFTIRSAESLSGVEIWNMLGVKVYDEKINSGTATIDLRNQKNGIYFYKVRDGEGKEITGKIIIQ